ncbi:MAG TPA: glycosyltransferase family A protein [Pyrinomonadaceae bacterium]|nr:glycosyltransferase family A protein [Pyrinomonadaceae bacterium]
MALPLTSVIIPAYNRAEYLPLTIESALAQSGAEVEVIVIDDGSTDDTRAVIEKNKARWGKRFRYFYQENAERCVARNNGLRQSRGEFVAFLDSDDLWRPHHVQACLAALTEDPNAAAAYSEHGLIDAEGKIIREHVTRARLDNNQFKREICLKQLILFPGEVVVRRPALDALGTTDVFDPDTMIGEEWLLWTKLLRHATFQRVGEPTVWRRLHPNTTWGDPDKFALQSVRTTKKVIETGLPETLGIPGERILAINRAHCAYGYYLAGQWSTARQQLTMAVRNYPMVLREPHFWRVVLRLCVGSRLSKNIRAARHKGKGKLVGVADSPTKP